MNSKYCSYDVSTKILSGKRYQHLYNAELNAGYLFLQKLAQNPKNVCQMSADTGMSMTNAEMYEKSLKFANHLRTNLKLKQGDVVGLIASNSENLAPIIIACMTLGVAFNPLSIVMAVDDISYMWTKLKPKVIFCDAKIIENVVKAAAEMKSDAAVYTMVDRVDGYRYADDILAADYDVEDFDFPDLPDISSTIAVINCSSGTTGSSKGICKPHRQVIAQSFLLWQRDFRVKDVIFNSTPSYWTLYMLFLTLSILHDIPSVISAQPIAPEMWMDIVDRYKATITVGSARLCAILLNSSHARPLNSIRYHLMGGSAFTDSLIKNWNQLLPNGKVLAGYGITEADALAISASDEGTVGLSSGFPFWNVQLKFIDDNGSAVGPNSVGEIYYKTAVTFSGYFGDAERYLKNFDSDGFIKSGDVGYFDDTGRVYVVERIANMIKSVGSHKITPGEVEAVINEIEGITQSCVVGIFDEQLFFDKIHAFVVVDKSAAVTEDYIESYVNNKVVAEKKIIAKGVFIVDDFPTTASGKILVRELKKMAVEGMKKKLEQSF